MIALDTNIEQVTVFLDRARVLRRGTTALDAGNHTLVIAGLPLGLDPDSIRASIRGSARARMTEVSVQRSFFEESPADRVRDLEAEIQTLEDRVKASGDQATLLSQQLTYLKDLMGQSEVFARGLAFGRITLSDQSALFDHLRQQSGDLMRAVHATEVERREMAKTLKKLRQELDQWQGARPPERYLARIKLEVMAAGQFEADLIYTLTGASWRPLYDLRLWEGSTQDAKPQMELTYWGQVEQQTGEDWTDVELTLSTARPALSGSLPELTPWYLDAYVPPPAAPVLAKAARAPMAAVLDMAAGSTLAAFGPKPAFEEVEIAAATVDSSGVSVAFGVGGRTTIPGDGEPHKTMIGRFSLEPRMDYLAVPRLTEGVHRRAEVVNSTGAIFLPGGAGVFVGEEFVGASDMKHVAPGQEFAVALGVDDRVKAKRELVAREVDKTFVGDRRRLHYGYRIRLENHRSSPETVVVRDQYPLPRHEQIKVVLATAAPEPKSTEMHLLEWQLEMDAGQEKVIRFDVQIEHPRSLQVVGLPD